MPSFKFAALALATAAAFASPSAFAKPVLPCPSGSKLFHYFKGSCASATEILITEGQCPSINGVQVELSQAYNCSDYSIAPGMTYCHECNPGQPVCSESKDKSQVCKDALELEVCNGGFDYEFDTYPCAAPKDDSKFDFLVNTCEEGVRTEEPEAQDCSDLGLSQCLNCADGMHICATDDFACEDLEGSAGGRAASYGGLVATVVAVIITSVASSVL